jgi:hypothetical protein
MKTMSFLLALPIMITLTACGSSSQSSSLNHVPVKGVKTCDTDVDVPGDPHARVYATRVVLAADMKNADVIEYSTHAFNLGTGKEIFNELYQESLKTFVLKLSQNQTLELVESETQKVVGSLVPVGGNSKKMTLNIDGYSDALTCRQTSK